MPIASCHWCVNYAVSQRFIAHRVAVCREDVFGVFPASQLRNRDRVDAGVQLGRGEAVAAGMVGQRLAPGPLHGSSP